MDFVKRGVLTLVGEIGRCRNDRYYYYYCYYYYYHYLLEFLFNKKMNFTSYEEVEVLETSSAVLAVEDLVECGGVRQEEGH